MNETPSDSGSRKSRVLRFTMFVRRLHLYAGLFLLPWVFLYGITGAMFNHKGLFPEVAISPVSASQLKQTTLDDFPPAEELAQEVAAALASATGADISLADAHGAEFNNNVILEVWAEGKKHSVHIDPVRHSAEVVQHPENQEALEFLLRDVRNIQLDDNPYDLARAAVPDIMAAAGIQSNQKANPQGWCKLNFLADVNGEPARITYVLRDGHVDVTRFKGEDGMTARQFFMRLHTSHGQPPSWNGRMFWSVALDIMAIAMVTWGCTGLIMWWQIKRTRRWGAVTLILSLITAGWMYASMSNFYATTQL